PARVSRARAAADTKYSLHRAASATSASASTRARFRDWIREARPVLRGLLETLEHGPLVRRPAIPEGDAAVRLHTLQLGIRHALMTRCPSASRELLSGRVCERCATAAS